MLPLARLQKSNTIDNIWVYILSLIKQQPMHAYQIQKEIEKKFGFQPGKITPYRVLYRLESEKFVKSKIQERKRIYQITEKGRKEFEKAKKFYQKILSEL